MVSAAGQRERDDQANVADMTTWRSAVSDDGRDAVAGPVVTPEPVPADDMVLRMSLAAAAGAVLGSFVAWRWLRRRVSVHLK